MNDWLSRKKDFFIASKIVLVCFSCDFSSYLPCEAFINITVTLQMALRFTFRLYGRLWSRVRKCLPRLLLQFGDRRVSRGGLKLRSWR